MHMLSARRGLQDKFLSANMIAVDRGGSTAVNQGIL